MQPEIGPIKTFGVMFALGFLASGAIIARRLKENGKPVDWAYEIVFAALLGGLVGSRLWYLLAHVSEFTDDPLGSAFGGSGLVWYGGALGGALFVIVWAFRKGALDLTLFDLCATPLALGYGIGRIGCQLSGDGDYGTPSHLPWAMAYPKGTVPTTIEVHPTPVYETLAMAMFAWVLWSLRDRVRPGALFAIYLVGAGVERFLVEFIRRNDSVVIGLTEAQVSSVVMALIGVVWLLVLHRRSGVLMPADAARRAPRAEPAASAAAASR